MKDILEVAIKSILLNKVRSMLTMLGVIIGVSSVVMLTAIGTGLSAYVSSEFESLGANTLFIMPGDVFGENGQISAESSATTLVGSKLSSKQVQDLERQREYVSLVSPLIMQSDTVKYRSEEVGTTILGTSDNIKEAMNLDTEFGQFYTKSQYEKGERVVVIGPSVADEIFGKIDPIGKKIKIGGQNFEVIGLIESKGGGLSGSSYDAYIFMPLTTFSKLYDNDSIIRIVVKTKDTANLEESKNVVENTLLKTLDDDEFTVLDQAELLSSINQILGVLTAGLGGIASISLIVGGIGIMNIMLVSVTERTREIGLRKALGATPNMILLQFLIEAAVLSLLGGGIGLILAYLGTLAMQAYFPATITMQAVALALGVSTVVGLIFGAAPARRAAKLSPIEALRYE